VPFLLTKNAGGPCSLTEGARVIPRDGRLYNITSGQQKEGRIAGLEWMIYPRGGRFRSRFREKAKFWEKEQRTRLSFRDQRKREGDAAARQKGEKLSTF